MAILQNPELDLAFEFVQNTCKNIFLTGKAGTGKTTFLHSLKNRSPKRMIVVAPTGVAAINAGGVTIHSFFQMPFGPHLPSDYNGEKSQNSEPVSPAPANIKRFNRDKINIIKSLDLLVIDEISMVRADLLDGIDEVLRRFKNPSKPFGGVQLLMIGDLQQLAPVVKEDEKEILKKYYDTFFFFSSKALQKTDFISIELKHIYRQSDPGFINLLNKVRDNKADAETLARLNERYIPDFNPDQEEGYIILTTHNLQAQDINNSKLNKLHEKQYAFLSDVKGDFPEYSYPTNAELILKKGAQVMFVKNDSSQDKMYYNGKIGTIEKFDDDIIYVRCPEESSPIPVERAEWQNLKYSIDDETKEIKEEIAGIFIQYPLKLAWAITIHKSQGLTFEKVIIDARSAFAHGQVYVALSRCKSLDGMILRTPIPARAIISDSDILEFNEDVEQNPPGQKLLENSKKDYNRMLLEELFSFHTLVKRINQCLYIVKESKNSLFGNIQDNLERIASLVKNEITDVAEKFSIQLRQLISEGGDIINNPYLQERVKKASVYFSEKLEASVLNILQDTEVETDNKEIRKSVKNALKRLREESVIKLSCLNSGREGFRIKEYLSARAAAAIEMPKPKPVTKIKEESITSGINHPELYERLKSWRNEKMAEMDVPPYMILPRKTMSELTIHLPRSIPDLKSINGMGNKKIKTFGDDILKIINTYCEEEDIAPPQHEITNPEPVKKQKPDTKKISFELLKSGKTVEEIASERGLTVSTVEGHLAHFVGIGELKIDPLITPEKTILISDYFSKSENYLMGPAKQALGDNVSYGEIRIVLKYLEYTGKIKIS